MFLLVVCDGDAGGDDDGDDDDDDDDDCMHVYNISLCVNFNFLRRIPCM